MVDEDLDATRGAHRADYRDASHFNREYKALFGAPPMRDVQLCDVQRPRPVAWDSAWDSAGRG